MIRLWLVEHNNDIYHYEFQVDEDQRGNVLYSKCRRALKFTDDVISNYSETYYDGIKRALDNMYKKNNFLKYDVVAFY